MKKILIYTIFRNSEKYLDLYYEQVKNIVETFDDVEFYFSGYENDSSDNTSRKLLSKDWSFFKDHLIVSENLKTEFFGSVVNEDRVRNLAMARNKAISAKDFMNNVDYIMMIDSDMKFDMDPVRKILNFDKKQDFDIVSGYTWHIVNDEEVLYDIWATRYDNSVIYSRGNQGNPWHNVSPRARSSSYDMYNATSNGICLLKAEPFKRGVRYGYINPLTGSADCEAVVICEEFKKAGYHKIFIIHDAKIEHIG